MKIGRIAIVIIYCHAELTLPCISSPEKAIVHQGVYKLFVFCFSGL